ncbi:MAG: hypothetical protein ABL865_07850, partial [Candidatus Nitrotoga sp.]
MNKKHKYHLSKKMDCCVIPIPDKNDHSVRLLSETTSHPTKQPKDGCKVVGYSRTQMYCLHPQ